MSTYHLRVKSHMKGKAADRSTYIAREGKYSYRSDDLVATGSGNLPESAKGNPYSLWKNADKHERANGCAAREFELALPTELTLEQQKEVLRDFIDGVIGDKPFQFAIHQPVGALSGQSNPHAHVLVCDRILDGIERPIDQIFRRYNPHYPSRGGARKDSGGKPAHVLREALIAQRKLWADIQNAALERHGHTARVDHRSLEEKGIGRAAERHIGPGAIRHMTEEDKARLVQVRTTRSHADLTQDT